jgi:multimeric flavodoxin WrbA
MNLVDTYANLILEKIENSSVFYKNKLDKALKYLEKKNNILFLTTSNRYDGAPDKPKSTQLAYHMREKLADKNVKIIEVPELNILPCTGNVSLIEGNKCGVKDALVKDKKKNPSGNIRCWQALQDKDEMYRVANAIFEADAIVFFASVRWGQTNHMYQKLIERLNWIENRHMTLGEDNIIKDKDAGIIAIGQNWNGSNVVKTEKQVFEFFGFNAPDALSFNWQYTDNAWDEKKSSFLNAPKVFQKVFDFILRKTKE